MAKGSSSPSDAPRPTPEAALIRRVREGLCPRLPVAEAAKRAGISAETWGAVERGYRKPRRDQPPIRVIPTAQTLAHMAHAVGLTPADLEKVDREDAAAILAEMQGAPEVASIKLDRGRMWFTVPAELPDEDREVIRRWAEEMAERLHRRSTERPDS